MKYIIPVRGYSLNEEFAIKNEYGETVLKVESNKYSLRKRISIRDQYAIEIGHIQKKLLAPGIAYEFYHEDQLKALMKRGRWLFRKRYKIKSVDGVLYYARGNFRELEYEIKIKGHRAARISKTLALRSENYAIEVEQKASPYICICIALAIEAIEKSG